MAFGQPAGPPAGQRQIDRLSELLSERGFDSFREARHRLDLTQRQANGRFTVAEADELIERLEAGIQVADSAGGALPAGVTASDAVTSRVARRSTEGRRRSQTASIIDLPDEVLADELVRRGWCCIPPSTDDT